MNIIEEAITFAGENLILTNQRALYWPKEEALILSDLHLGKAAHFRKHGIALPIQIAERDIYRLEYLIAYYAVRQVVVTGDLIHAGANEEVKLFAVLTARFPKTTFILIKGNHDRISDHKLETIGIHAVQRTLRIGDICFSHEHVEGMAGATISGHIHPGVSLQLPTNKQLRYPCYAVTETQIILPAFSTFTGLDTVSIPDEAVCYAFYEQGFFKSIK